MLHGLGFGPDGDPSGELDIAEQLEETAAEWRQVKRTLVDESFVEPLRVEPRVHGPAWPPVFQPAVQPPRPMRTADEVGNLLMFQSLGNLSGLTVDENGRNVVISAVAFVAVCMTQMVFFLKKQIHLLFGVISRRSPFSFIFWAVAQLIDEAIAGMAVSAVAAVHAAAGGGDDNGDDDDIDESRDEYEYATLFQRPPNNAAPGSPFFKLRRSVELDNVGGLLQRSS